MIDKIKNLFNLYFSFAKIGTFTIGGGLAMMPMMQSELIEKRKWITDEELIDYYAVGQSTPGIVAVNVATFVGYKQMGIIGGIFATLGMVTPSLVIIMILASLINSINDFPIIQKALKGINVAVAALLTSTIINFMKKTIKKFTNAIFMMISFLLVFVFKLPSFWIILFALLIGVVLTYKEKKKVAAVEEDSKKIDGEGK
ncbi:MAG: chromate transporter [Treponema sp.]|nr:chromate transporter [Treponema sp.]MBO5482802.1 chromate transporter [Spirochaetaceae bacterium]MBR6582625.1 chromate transporter [Treponema sp.]